MNNVLLSFIVPFYNVENYLKECIDSLYHQDLPIDKYEVILINDCSTDSSGDIALSLKEIYPTLILIEHNRNKKQAGARNTGLKTAKGEYIWFVDSDDYIKPNVSKKLVDMALLNDLDVLHFDYASVNNNGEILEYPKNSETDIIDGNTFFFDKNEIWWKKAIEVWRRIHKRTFLLENNLFFDENVFYEDITYSIRTFNSAKRVMHISETPYCYRNNPFSFTNSPITYNKLLESLKLSLRCIDLSQNTILNEKYKNLLVDFSKYHIYEIKNNLMLLDNIERTNFNNNSKKLPIKNLKSILNWKDYLFIKNVPYQQFILKIKELSQKL